MSEVIHYEKLVRDGMEAVVKADGRRAEFKYLSYHDILAALCQKLIEEAKEAAESPFADELADLQTVMQEIMRRTTSQKAVDAAAERKLRERGGFRDGLYMVWAEAPPANYHEEKTNV